MEGTISGPHPSCGHGGECCTNPCGPVYRREDAVRDLSYRHSEATTEEFAQGLRADAQIVAAQEVAARESKLRPGRLRAFGRKIISILG